MRKAVALTAAAGLLLSLAACSTSAPSGTCETTISAGDSSSLVTATGSFGAQPVASFPTPLVTDGIQVSTLTKGDGPVLYPGEYATFQITAFDAATTNARLTGTYDPAQAFITHVGAGTSNLGRIFECQTVGSRIAATVTAADLYGFLSVDKTVLPDPKQTLVIVADIEGSALGKAYGTLQSVVRGMPSVVTAPDGTPGITIPAAAAPSVYSSAVIRAGDGETVTAGESVWVHYLRTSWTAPSSGLKSTWANDGVPERVTLTELNATDGTGINAGMLKAIVGQKVGSQVIAIVPPSLGFPAGSEPSGVTAGDTLVYVIDILGVAAGK